VVHTDGSVEELSFVSSIDMEPGELFVIETPGGGGYGTSLTTATEGETQVAVTK
jgi:5-oxoprolinase (ATP-hydrolysing)